MSKQIRTYKILVGPHAGEILDGYQIGCRLTPDGEADWKHGDHVWIPSLEQSFTDGIGTDKEAQDCLLPVDKYNARINVGDTLYVAVKRGVVKAEVVGYGKPYHHGCGWYERQLQLKDADTGKKFVHNHPYASIKI